MNKRFTRIMAVVLCVLMVVSALPLASFAAISNYHENTSANYSVFKHTESTLAPGITQYINYAYDANGRQVKYHVATADLSDEDVIVQTSYKDQYANGQFGMSKVSEQMAFANQFYTDSSNDRYISDYYTAVAGINASFYNMQSGQPSGRTVLDGISIGEGSYGGFFALLDDGTAVIMKDSGTKNWDSVKDKVVQAIGGESVFILNGEKVTPYTSYFSNVYPHSLIGITADNQVVIVEVDGGTVASAGLGGDALADIMLEAGCVSALSLDGGGSATYCARPEGENNIKVVNTPGDGSERSISAGVIFASKAAPSNVFDHAIITPVDSYVTVGTSTAISVKGVSPAGTSADIPENITYEATNGTVVNGEFTATELGVATITAKVDGVEVGSATVNVVVPTKITFNQSEMVIPFGKTVELAVTATVNDGLNNVKLNENDVEYSFTSDIGTVNGFYLTAAAENSGATGAVCTVSVKGTELSATTSITLGKGSESLANFEDGTNQGIISKNLTNYNYRYPGNTSSVVDATNGQVHSGNYALKVDLDYSNSTEGGYMGTALAVSQDVKLENPIAIGFWMYVPEELPDGFQMIFRPYDSLSNARQKLEIFKIGQKSVIKDAGWYYFSFDLSSYKNGLTIKSSNVLFDLYFTDRDGSSFGYNHITNGNWNQNCKFTFYIDDITIDYSTAIDDREAPEFGDVTYADKQSPDASVLKDNGSILSHGNDNVFDFSVKVDENTAKSNATGLDDTTAKAYIDGKEIACEYKNGFISVADAYLTNGNHTIKFTMCDKQGNMGIVSRSFTVTSGSTSNTIKFVAHDSSLDNILLGSIYYMDVVSTSIENVDTVNITLDLDQMSVWQLDHMNVTPGFEATYEYDSEDNLAIVSITKTGDVKLTGENALVSIPVRTWELPCGPSGDVGAVKSATYVYNYAIFRASKENYPIWVKATVSTGTVKLADGTTTSFSGDVVKVNTESRWWDNDTSATGTNSAEYKAWNGGHDHRAETKQYYATGTTNHVDARALEDKAPTCTEDGYTGRTYCDVCKSVVDWGTTVPATDHTWTVVEGVLKCQCGELFNGYYTDGKLYADGLAVNGWLGDYYFVDGISLTGVAFVDGYYYDFGEDGVCVGKYTGLVDIEGVNYYAKLGVLSSGWYEVDDVWYYFVPATNAAADGDVETTDGITFNFDNGKVTNVVWVNEAKGTRCWYGPSYYKLTSKNVPYIIVEIGGKTYLFDTDGYVKTGLVPTHESNRTTLIWYECASDGVATLITGPKVQQYRSTLYYIDENGMSIGNGVTKIGNDYYYVEANGIIKTNIVRYVSGARANGLVEAYKDYTIGADGKMQMPAPKNGVVNGYLYIDNVKVTTLGVVKYGNDFYYIENSYKVAVSIERYVSAARANDLIPAYKDYTIGADGKIQMPEPRNGVVNGYLYENDVKVTRPGVYKLGNDYYYIENSTRVAMNIVRYVSGTRANGLIPAYKDYTIGADGKIQMPAPKNGFVNGYLYENDVKVTRPGVYKLGNDYYYIENSTRVATNIVRYVSSARANGLVPAYKDYTIGSDGKMIVG